MIGRRDVARMRSWAESLMDDIVRITAPASISTDPETGAETASCETLYEGKAKIQTAGGVASQQHNVSGTGAVGAFVPEWGLYLHLPCSAAPELYAGCVATVVSSKDPALVGRRLRLVNMQSEKTHATARRWNVQEIPPDRRKT